MVNLYTKEVLSVAPFCVILRLGTTSDVVIAERGRGERVRFQSGEGYTFVYNLMGRSFRLLEVPNGNNFALVDPIYAAGVVHHRGRRAPMR